MRKTLVLAFAATTALAVPNLNAQQQLRLTDAEAAFPESFSTVRGLEELDDGRLLIADGLGQALMIVDMNAGTADTIGRVGPGPQEYKTPDGLWRLPGGNWMLVDLGNGRLTMMDSDFKFGKTYPIMGQNPGGQGPGSILIRIPRGIDSQGRVYLQTSAGMTSDGQLRDSAAVIRWDPLTDAVDTIAMVKEGDRKLETSGGSNNRNISISSIPLSPRDGWAVAPDGRVALVRSGDYSIHWMDPDGSVTTGRSNAYEPVRIGQPEKEDWVDQLGRNGLAIRVSINNGARQASFSRGGPSRGGGGQSTDDYEWPEHMPAFNAPRIRVGPAGNLWVRRYGKKNDDVVFDLFDGSGKLIKQVVLPPGRDIAGFGRGVVYTTAADEFDLIWLERFRLET
ncbi:MAG: hypothetical protein V3T56_01015 [Gemmatimonadales bacterium]